MVDYTNNLIEFCIKYKIELIGEYANVKKSTPIYFKCGQCENKVRKTYKNLTEFENSPNVCIWSGYCNKCFYLIHH